MRNSQLKNDLMTPTMKIKRHKIKDKYKNILENFYKKKLIFNKKTYKKR